MPNRALTDEGRELRRPTTDLKRSKYIIQASQSRGFRHQDHQLEIVSFNTPVSLMRSHKAGIPAPLAACVSAQRGMIKTCFVRSVCQMHLVSNATYRICHMYSQ